MVGLNLIKVIGISIGLQASDALCPGQPKDDYFSRVLVRTFLPAPRIMENPPHDERHGDDQEAKNAELRPSAPVARLLGPGPGIGRTDAMAGIVGHGSGEFDTVSRRNVYQSQCRWRRDHGGKSDHRDGDRSADHHVISPLRAAKIGRILAPVGT